MKKLSNQGDFLRYLLKLIRVMKITFFLIIVTSMMVIGSNSYSQSKRLSLNLKSANLRDIFETIEQSSEFIFLYQDQNLDMERKIDITGKDLSITEILDKIFEGTGNIYRINNRQIIIGKDNQSILSIFPNTTIPLSVEQKQKSVSGRVTDLSGYAVPGVSIVVKGTTIGTISDANGNYSLLDIPDKAVLQFSFIGMKSQEIQVGESSMINIKLEEQSIGIDEVVAVGYGTMRKSDLTGSVVSVHADQISQTLSTTVEQSLSGRASGVQVTQSEGAPGAGVKIRIRGNTSINAGNEPLYVIDGFPVESGGNSVTAGGGISTTSILATMNPNDIESIEVLKDASATAIYGSRGANGVILITTKSGANDRQNISFSAFTGVSRLTKKLEVLKGNDYINYFNEAAVGTLTGNAMLDYAIRDENKKPILDYLTYNNDSIWKFGSADKFLEHDWQDEIFRTAVVNEYNLSFSGGNKKMNYLASVGYFNQEGIVVGSNYERYTANLKLTNNFSDKLQMGFNLYTGYSINDGILSATYDSKTSSGVINNTILFRPVYGYDIEGNQVTNLDTDSQTFELTNPVQLAKEQQNLSTAYNLRANYNLNFEILPGLEFNIKIGANMNTNKVKSWYPGHFGLGKAVGGGVAFLNSGNTIGWLNDNLLSYVKNIGEHRINTMVGFSQQSEDWEGFSISKSKFQIQSINVDNIGSGTEFQSSGSGSGANRWTLRSWLGRFNYTFKDKYLFTLTGRADGSSRFPAGSKWAFFPSGAFAWRLGEEPFIKSINLINDLKLHASYGLSGNQAIPSYASLDTYGFYNYAFSNVLTTGLAAERLENNGLSWETTKQVDLGVDLTMLKDRISLNAVYYNKLTENLLMEANVPYTSGFERAWKNTGSIVNHGMEFTINSTNIQTKEFTWHSNFNISFNKNKVKALNNENGLDYILIEGPTSAIHPSHIIKVGEEVGSIYGLIWDGINQLSEYTFDASKTHAELLNTRGYIPKEGYVTYSGIIQDPGTMKFRDIAGAFDENGNPIPDGDINNDDRTIIGNANPKHYGGFSNDFTYKNFDLSVLMNWSYGNDILNENMALAIQMNNPYTNQYVRALDRWTPENPTNELFGINQGNGECSTFYIEDGSFLRLSNVTLGYNLPKVLMKKWNISNTRIYVSGDNLHVWTKYSGYDPEVSVGGDAMAPGIDFSAYPRSRTFRLGIKIDL